MTIFSDIAILVVLAVLFGFLAHRLKQPVIIGFIFAGFIIGILGRLGAGRMGLIEELASIGIALLLFLVGLEMNFRELKHVGIPAILIGLGQIIFTFGVGFVIVKAIGFASMSAFYIAIALTFSSTIVVVKLLSEKGDLESLYGKIVVGFLLVQDAVAILLLIFLSSLGESAPMLIAITVAKGAGLLAATIIASRFLPRVLDLIGRSQEMLYLFGIAWALGVAALAAEIGLSIEVGGFLAGLALAGSSEHFQLAARLRPLRDFFILLFFVWLGTQALAGASAIPVATAAILAAFVLVGNPLIVLLIMGALGYRARTSFLASLTVAQISEFSLIVAALGRRIGHIGDTEVSLVTLVGMFTIFVSSYFIAFGDSIYDKLRPAVKRFEFRRRLVEELPPPAELSGHTILVGVHRMGESIVRSLSNLKEEFVAIDFNPKIVRKLGDMGIPVLYGDITDPDIQERIGLSSAGAVISTIPAFRDNLAIIKETNRKNPNAVVVLTAEDEWYARELYDEGADYVLIPHFLGGQELARAISEDGDLKSLSELKERDIATLGNGGI